MSRYTPGDAKADLVPLQRKLERLGEEARSTHDTLVTRAKEIGHPDLVAPYRAAADAERIAALEADLHRERGRADDAARRLQQEGSYQWPPEL